TPETFATEPGLEDFFAIHAALHGAEAGNQDLVKRQKTAVDGKPARGQQHVVKQIRPRAVAAHHKDRSRFAINWTGVGTLKILARKARGSFEYLVKTRVTEVTRF